MAPFARRTDAASVRVGNPGGAVLDAYTVLFFEDRNLDGAFQGAEDSLLAWVVGPQVLGDESADVSGLLSGTLLFAGNLVHAFVDADGQVWRSPDRR